MTDYEILRQMADDVANGDNSAAHDKFNSIIGARVADALQDKKQEIAQNIYSASNSDTKDSEEE
jgi:hypothetical protein